MKVPGVQGRDVEVDRTPAFGFAFPVGGASLVAGVEFGGVPLPVPVAGMPAPMRFKSFMNGSFISWYVVGCRTLPSELMYLPTRAIESGPTGVTQSNSPA